MTSKQDTNRRHIQSQTAPLELGWLRPIRRPKIHRLSCCSSDLA